jgi:hypothetical protein
MQHLQRIHHTAHAALVELVGLVWANHAALVELVAGLGESGRWCWRCSRSPKSRNLPAAGATQGARRRKDKKGKGRGWQGTWDHGTQRTTTTTTTTTHNTQYATHNIQHGHTQHTARTHTTYSTDTHNIQHGHTQHTTGDTHNIQQATPPGPGHRQGIKVLVASS